MSSSTYPVGIPAPLPSPNLAGKEVDTHNNYNVHNSNATIQSENPAQPQHHHQPSKVGQAFATAFAPVVFAWKFLRRWTNLTVWIIVAMVVGILLGKYAPDFSVQIAPLGDLLIRMIQCVVGPLIFSTLVVGIAGHGDDLVRIGRLAVKALVYFEVVTTFALIIGLLAVNIAKPGTGYDMSSLIIPTGTNATMVTWQTELQNIVPTSFFLALTDHSAVLAIVFCAIMFSVAIMHADVQSKKVMLDFNASLSAVMFKVVNLIMNYAPIGIGAALAATIGKYGLGALALAGKLVGTLYLTLIIFAVIIILPIVLLCRLPLKDYLRAVGQPFLLAFSTASSESALPLAMENMVAYGCPPEIVAFVIPTGYSFNLDGSTLYLALASMFCAQVAGISKPVGEQIVMMVTLMLTSKGVAAVPRASFIVLVSTLSNANIPLQPLSLILGVDAFMDMARTSINVLGNMTACAVISKWEGEFRNDAWRARQAGVDPETLIMDEVENNHHDQFSHGHGQGVLPMHTQGHMHEVSSPHFQSSQLDGARVFSDKASIHSVRSVHSTTSSRRQDHIV